MISYRDGTDPFDYPEYVAMVKKVDPNDPDQVTFPMITRWMSYKLKEFDGSRMDKYISFMKKYGRKLKKPEINKLLADNMISHTMMDIDIENPDIYEPFFAELEKFVLDGNKLVEICRGQIEAAINAQPGKPVPDTFLRTPDGQDVALSSLFGKVLYVDVWATWCGPCVKEGPYFRALAEKYRDDPRICFISLSTDDSDEPWLEFLENEKPFWPQYRLDGVNNDDFCNKVGIQTIPRFLLIDAEGNFINSDCARPSSEEIETLLDLHKEIITSRI